jgi:hypothetical protein
MKISTRTRLTVGIVGGVVAVAAAGAVGFEVASTTGEPFSRGYEAGVTTTRLDFCNLQFRGKAGKPSADDPRTYSGLPANLIVADRACSPEVVSAWNQGQEDAGSDKRACTLDDQLTALVGAYVCTVTTTTSY